MPVKILLADKSITIQKVVEMLFSGKEYEVTCVSDGESAFAEATRVVPDVVLADVDLPRIDGYSFAGRLRETPALAKVPVVLMLSRDDVFDAMKGKLAGIVDNIAKPFESQDLIGKVKKALTAAPPAAVAPAASPKPAVAPPPPPKPVVAPPAPPKPAAAPPPPPKPKEPVPSDIFDIIEEAPAKAAVQEATAPPPQAAASQEETFEVEPEYEVEVEPEPEQPAGPGDQTAAAASAAKAEAEEWAALAAEPDEEPASSPAKPPPSAVPDAFDTDQLFGKEPEVAAEPSAPIFEPAVEAEAAPPSFDFSEPLPSEAEEALPLGQKAMDEMREGLGLGGDEVPQADRHPDIVSFESLDMASRAGHEDYTFSPPASGVGSPMAEPAQPAPTAPAAVRPPAGPLRAPEVSDEMLRGVAREAIEKVVREVLERVAWEVIPDLAERLIREEIERLKSEP